MADAVFFADIFGTDDDVTAHREIRQNGKANLGKLLSKTGGFEQGPDAPQIGAAGDWRLNFGLLPSLTTCVIGDSSAFLDKVRKGPFHLAEPGDAKPDEEGSHPEAEGESGHVNWTVSAQDAPAKAVDDANHGIQIV